MFSSSDFARKPKKNTNSFQRRMVLANPLRFQHKRTQFEFFGNTIYIVGSRRERETDKHRERDRQRDRQRQTETETETQREGGCSLVKSGRRQHNLLSLNGIPSSPAIPLPLHPPTVSDSNSLSLEKVLIHYNFLFFFFRNGFCIYWSVTPNSVKKF